MQSYDITQGLSPADHNISFVFFRLLDFLPLWPPDRLQFSSNYDKLMTLTAQENLTVFRTKSPVFSASEHHLLSQRSK
jgi:hypothetical protein